LLLFFVFVSTSFSFLCKGTKLIFILSFLHKPLFILYIFFILILVVFFLGYILFVKRKLVITCQFFLFPFKLVRFWNYSRLSLLLFLLSILIKIFLDLALVHMPLKIFVYYNVIKKYIDCLNQTKLKDFHQINLKNIIFIYANGIFSIFMFQI